MAYICQSAPKVLTLAVVSINFLELHEMSCFVQCLMLMQTLLTNI